MNPIPDIVIIDFCDWLKHRMDLNKQVYLSGIATISLLDILIDADINGHLLRKYADEFLRENKHRCYLTTILPQFLASKEFYNLRRFYRNECQSCNYHSIGKCPCLYEIESSFDNFITDLQKDQDWKMRSDISAHHLADYLIGILYSDEKINRFPQLLQLMNLSKETIEEELYFFEWIQKKLINPMDVRKMPADIFEGYVDDYIRSCGKGTVERKLLLNSYHQTGWENLLKKFRKLFHFDRIRFTKNFEEITKRYYSIRPRFKCILLPLSDRESQKQYQALITDSWNDLNQLSGDYLDIYYSELDTGKSGYDIAKRIYSLPQSLKSKAPCLIIWDDYISDAQHIPLDELNSLQIVSVIRAIVNSIVENKNLQEIVTEVSEKVKEIQETNHGVNRYYGPVFTGDRNVVGDNNVVGIGNVVGDANIVLDNSATINSDESYVKELMAEFGQAILAIKSSSELDDDLKTQVCEIVEDAKNGMLEKSEEKQKRAKTAFSYVKVFLAKIAPNLLATLANLATIADFFGLSI